MTMRPVDILGSSHRLIWCSSLAALLALAGCDRSEGPLPGQRMELRPAPDAASGSETARAIALPGQVRNADWPQRNSSASGVAPHAALSAQPRLRWSVPVGARDEKRLRTVTQPVVAGGLAFVKDAQNQVTAVNRSGQVVWRQNLVPEGESPDSGPGGGLAVANNVLFATTGFGEVTALSASSGQILWRHPTAAAIAAAPIVSGSRVYVVVRDDTALALNASNGQEVWATSSIGGTGLMGGASPAVSGSLAVMPFASGEVAGLRASDGLQLWATAIVTGRRELSRGQINDISGAPVISGSSVYAASQNGRTIRINRETGIREWTMAEGAYGPVVPAGGSLFLVSDLGEIVRANAGAGEVIWSTPLPQFYARSNWLGRILGDSEPIQAVTHFGPLLAGGRIWVASGDGAIRGFSPVSGDLQILLDLPNGAAGPPVVAGGVMYVVSRDGQLHAFQ